MYIKFNNIPRDKKKELLISFDLEWTKNYRIKNGNKPFCFSYVFVYTHSIPTKIEELDFGFNSHYIEHEEEIPLLLENAEMWFKLLSDYRGVLLGHQLSSDISVMLNFRSKTQKDYLSQIRYIWRNRKNDTIDFPIKVFDTRYDIDRFLFNKSRRLVDVCKEYNLNVKQTELTVSMTKMQNQFLETHDISLMEKISVLNLRHSLSAILLFYFYKENRLPVTTVNLNSIIYKNLKPYYKYVKSDVFRALM